MLTEVSPSSEWAQRWTGGQHTWRHRSDGGFDPDHYSVRPIDEVAAKAWVLEHHYSCSYPAAKLRYGLYEGDDLAGVAVLSVPTSKPVLTNVFPDLEPYVESVELGRLVLADRVPANGESWFLARAFDEAAAVGVRGVVSFADPVPRRLSDGRLLFPGHVGTIYQALNARCCGRATARTLTLLADGTILNDRAMQKVRSGHKGHEYIERRLVALGARLPTGDRTRWLADALDDIGARRLRHGGNHRYVFALGTRSQRRGLRITGLDTPYPKRPDGEG
jgi:hypothetical protein